MDETQRFMLSASWFQGQRPAWILSLLNLGFNTSNTSYLMVIYNGKIGLTTESVTIYIATLKNC